MVNSTANGIGLYKEVCKYLDSFKGSLIEFGCRGGRFGVYYKNGVYVGIDIAPTLVKIAKIRCALEAHRYTRSFYVADITEQFDIKKKPFDNLLISEVLEHIQTFGQTFNNIRRYATKRSSILVTVPCKPSSFTTPWKTSPILKQFGIDEEYFHNAYTMGEIVSLLESEDLAIAESKTMFGHNFVLCKRGT